MILLAVLRDSEHLCGILDRPRSFVRFPPWCRPTQSAGKQVGVGEMWLQGNNAWPATGCLECRDADQCHATAVTLAQRHSRSGCVPAFG